MPQHARAQRPVTAAELRIDNHWTKSETRAAGKQHKTVTILDCRHGRATDWLDYTVANHNTGDIVFLKGSGSVPKEVFS